MKSITKYIVVNTVLLLSFTTYTSAGSNLPKSKQAIEEKNSVEEIVLIPEIKIDAQSTSPSNPKLKEGKACDDDLEEVKGELFTEIPMAETIPCDKVNCNDLSAAKMVYDNYKPLPDAKTVSCDGN